jgi:hypothetical protein
MGKHFNSVVELNSLARHSHLFANRVRNTLAELLIVAMAVAFAAPAFAQIPVNQCGQVLSKPGNYVLTTDLCDGPPNEVLETGLVINASNVHLNTAGHSISAFFPALVIDDGVSNIRIDGGGSVFGGTGVSIGASRDITLNNLTLFGSASSGAGIAVELNGAKRVTVTNSTIEFVGCGGGGPAISGTVDNGLFSHNTITSGSCAGFIGGIGVDGADNTIRDNTINPLSTPLYGISVTSDTVIAGNTITLTPPESGAATEMIGIDLTGHSNLVNGNTIHGDANTNSYGIFAAQGAIRNRITNNTAEGDQYDLFDSNGPPCVNLWKRNTFQTSGGAVACIK